jgi:mono/diheme cytochrome c family protein
VRRPWRYLLWLAVALGAAQLVPYGRAHDNPPVGQEPAWDVAATGDLVHRACFDCHSNQTRWPWYSHLAPASWLVQRDVDEGRSVLNFTQFELEQPRAALAADEVGTGAMPPWFYLPAHPEARLSAAERRALVEGLRNTLK